MADNRTMAQMLQAPIEGYEDAIVVPPINANNFELKQPLINLVQSNKFTGRQDPHNHLRFFNKTWKPRDWLDKEPPRSILTWDDLVSKFINQYFPPSKTTYYRNEIITFYQKPNEAFNEAWERFKGLLRQCPHHGFSELHQLDTFYNSLNSNDQDALILQQSDYGCPLSNSSSSNNSFEMQQIAASLEDKMTIKMNKIMNEMKALVVTTPAPVKAVEERCTTCGNNHSFNVCPMTRGSYEYPVYHDNFQQFQQTASVGNFVQNGNSGYRAPNLANQMRPPGFNQPNPQASRPNQGYNANQGYNGNRNTRTTFLTHRAHIPPPLYDENEPLTEKETEVTKDKVLPSTKDIQPPVIQKSQDPVKPVSSPISPEPSSAQVDNSPPSKEPSKKNRLPYPSRVEHEKKGENDKVQIQKFWEMFKKIHVDITLADALILVPKYQKMLKSLLSNKEKLNEMANTPVSETCSAIILKKLPEKLGDPGQFLIPCNFSELKCKALADLGASINLMPFSVYTKLGLPALQSTRMTLELANCSLCVPKGIARDVLVPISVKSLAKEKFIHLLKKLQSANSHIFPTKLLRTRSPMGNEDLNFVPNKELDKEILIPIPRESKIGKDCDFPSCDDFQSFKTFSNPLFEKQDDFPSRNDESILKEETFKSYLNPLFEDDEEIISNEASSIISPKIDVKTIMSFFAPIGNCVRKWATSEVEKDNVEVNHEVFKSNNENVLGIHDNEEEEIAFLDGLLEDENFFETNDKKVESFERKTKEDFETKVEPEKKKELQVFHPDIEILDHLETTSYVGSDYVFYEDFNLVDMIFPMNIQGKIFDPGISHFDKDTFNDDKSSKELAPSKALLTLDVFDPLHPPLMDFNVTKAFFGFTFSILKFFSKKFVEPGIKNVLVYLSSLVWGGCHLLDFLHHCYYPP
ncbi:reverse transcriptase domain-containing protein [Tanacetum coccineum]